MSTWAEKVRDWERMGEAKSSYQIDQAHGRERLKDRIVELLYDVERACVSARYFVARDDQMSADVLRNSSGQWREHYAAEFMDRHFNLTVLYHLLEPLRDLLGKELVRLGEMARDADDPETKA